MIINISIWGYEFASNPCFNYFPVNSDMQYFDNNYFLHILQLSFRFSFKLELLKMILLFTHLGGRKFMFSVFISNCLHCGQLMLSVLFILLESENVFVVFVISTRAVFMLLFSHSVMSDSLQPIGLQQARPLCPSPSPKVCPSSCPSHQWCCPAISSSDALFSFCPQSFPAARAFPMSQLFALDDQNTGVSALASVLPTSIQGWFPLRFTGLFSLLSKGISGVFYSTISIYIYITYAI